MIFCFVLLETFLVSSILCSNGVSIKIYNKGGFGCHQTEVGNKLHGLKSAP